MNKINNNITWKKKSQKVSIALVKAQNHCKLANVCVLVSAKTRFAYILHSLKILLVNKDNIYYIYVPMPGVVNENKTYKPSDKYWEVLNVVVHTMKEVVESIH